MQHLDNLWHAYRTVLIRFFNLIDPDFSMNLFRLAGLNNEVTSIKTKFMSTSRPLKITVFFILSLLTLSGLVISSVIMINQLGMNQRLQGWVNLLWLPLPVLILIVDRICVRKFGAKNVNKIQWYILAILILLVILNYVRLLIE